MSLVHELAASVQCCFELFGTRSDGVLLSRQDQAQLNEVSSILQPVLLRLQKQAVSVAESSELFAEDEALLGAVVHLRRALQRLQRSVVRCNKTSHWLLRVLTAEEVRQGLESGFRDTAAALQELLEAEGDTDTGGSLSDVSALHTSLVDHKVSRHEGLERLGSGLYKHMEAATDAEHVVAMLRFVVREAQNLSMMRRKHSRASSSSGSRRDSDSSDTSIARLDQDSKAAAAEAVGAAAAAAGAGASSSASSMDTGSTSDGSSSSSRKAAASSSRDAGGGSSSSKGGKGASAAEVPPGETSLTDVQLLLGVQQLADSRTGTQQLVLHQVLSILEELHEQKARQLKHKQRKSAAAAAAGGASGGQLQSVPEGGSADDTIAAVRRSAEIAATAANHHFGSNAAVMAAAASGQPVTYGTAVAAVSGGLEELLASDPWDAAALTQLLELLLQTGSSEEEYVEVEEEEEQQQHGAGRSNSNGSSSSKGKKDGSSSKGRKWWGQMGAAAKAALGGGGSSGGSSKSNGAKGGRKAAAGGRSAAADEAQQQQRQERIHQLVSSALDVLLRLTPLPPSCTADSCFKPLARPDMASRPARSLALPLMAHCDTVAALSGCIWSSWNDVTTKAARLLTILMRSEGSLADSAGIAAAVGLTTPPSAVFMTFCHGVCSTGGTSGSAWHGLVTLLHSSNLASAAAAAEAIAAIGSSSRSHELCSSLAASQAARPLLLLLSKHQLHLGAGGAAAAALAALSDARVRPGMHDLLVSSYTEHITGTRVPLGDSCIAIMLGPDCLAACRAARLAASLAHGINWATAATGGGSSNGSSNGSSGAAGSLWGETFRAGQHLMQRSRSSSAAGAREEGSPTVAGAQLLRALVLAGCKRGAGAAAAAGTAAAGADVGGGEGSSSSSRGREEVCMEALVLAVAKLQGYEVTRTGKAPQVRALLELLSALVGHMSEAAVCGALPELFRVVVPLLETVQRGGSSSSSSSNGSSDGGLQQVAQQLHEQLMVLGG